MAWIRFSPSPATFWNPEAWNCNRLRRLRLLERSKLLGAKPRSRNLPPDRTWPRGRMGQTRSGAALAAPWDGQWRLLMFIFGGKPRESALALAAGTTLRLLAEQRLGEPDPLDGQLLKEEISAPSRSSSLWDVRRGRVRQVGGEWRVGFCGGEHSLPDSPVLAEAEVFEGGTAPSAVWQMVIQERLAWIAAADSDPFCPNRCSRRLSRTPNLATKTDGHRQPD